MVWGTRVNGYSSLHRLPKVEKRAKEAEKRIRPKRSWLGRLLANERAVGPVLNFITNTEVGSRDGARERELEWQKKSDQEGEDQVTD